ncbi:MAG: threonine synthase [Treponema sp.]|jgi:threonine synthase|nr:threonine synthase [Treponema sp.]
MQYYSTRSKNNPVGFAKAALTGLAPDGGLYVPAEIPEYSTAVKSSLGTMSYTDIAYETIKPWVIDDIPSTVLEEMIHKAYTFNAPLVSAGNRFVLELFHGPSAAFKDFGARFMAQVFSYLRRGETQPLNILCATSGDTGGAVADGFFGAEGIIVTVLYPRGRISELQEKQIAGLGGNIRAFAVDGSFDDCQRLVKEAFADVDLKKRLCLASANSINVSRLIPQASYYASAAGRAFAGLVDPDGEATPKVRGKADSGKKGGIEGYPRKGEKQVFSVPSGNFGNLTAGLYAYKMGAPIGRFIAATNINKTVPDYLENGNYRARPSLSTISNAMDVGAPSNFERMAAHFSWEEMRSLIAGVFVTDEECRVTISEVFEKGYYLDPHTAVGWNAVDKLKEAGVIAQSITPIILSTAHPAKFAEVLENLTGPVPVPPSLQRVMDRTINTKNIGLELVALKEHLY